jgi:hypothetical protein
LKSLTPRSLARRIEDHEARISAIELILFGKASPKPLTVKTLARRIAREQESADRHTAGLPPLKARKKPASKKRKAKAAASFFKKFDAFLRAHSEEKPSPSKAPKASRR